MNDRDKQIIDLYINHPEISIIDIAKQFNISTGTISRIARINNLPRRKGNSGKKLSIQDEKDIVNKYLNSISLLALQKEYNISYDRIKNIIKKYTNTTISSAKRLNPNLIEDFFQDIDTTEKAYWIGWLITDGSITYQPQKNKYQIELTIKQQDEYILHLLANDLGVPDRVYSSGTEYKRFSLGSKKMVNDLLNLGLTQKKTFTVQVPNIKSNLYPALIRGLFDGDGGYSICKKTNGQINRELSFCGNEYVINWLKQTLYTEIPNLTHKRLSKSLQLKELDGVV